MSKHKFLMPELPGVGFWWAMLPMDPPRAAHNFILSSEGVDGGIDEFPLRRDAVGHDFDDWVAHEHRRRPMGRNRLDFGDE